MERYYATEREVKSRCVETKRYGMATNCGPTIFNDGYSDYVVPHEGHVMCFGGTGAGKTSRVLLPTIEKIARCQEGMLIVDPKPEIICRTKALLQQNGYKIYYLNFADYWRSQRYNLLLRVQKLYEKGDRTESFKLLDEIGTALFQIQIENNKDPYFGMNGRDLFVGAGIVLLEAGAELTFENICVLISDSKGSFAGSDFLTEYVKAKGSYSEAAMRLAGRAYAPRDTAGCIDSVASTIMNPYIMESLCDMMCCSEFSFASLAEGKVAIFIITPADDGCMETYVGLLVRQAYDELKDLAIQQKNGRLPKTVHFIIDEFCNFPIPAVERMVMLARGYNERFYLGIQNYGSLTAKYGADTANTIWANSEIKFVLRSSDIQLGELLEHLCGMRVDPVVGVQRPLISVTDIQRLNKENGEAIVLIDGLRPFVTTFPSIYDHEWDYPYYSIKQLPLREPVVRTHFNFQELVKEMKRSKLLETLTPILQKEKEAEEDKDTPILDYDESSIRKDIEDMQEAIDREFQGLCDLYGFDFDREDAPLP